MTIRGTLLIGLSFALFLTLNACGNPSAPYQPTVNVPVQGVKVSPQGIQFSVVGETRNITATIYPANATDQAIHWESTDSTVASVDSTGRVTAKAVGFGVFITAYTHDGAHQASANVTVNP